MMYANGKGVIGNNKTAVKWYTLAAEQGYSVAQNNLGLMYANGKGVVGNYRVALKWRTLAAKQGNASAQFYLGNMYQFGKGVPQHYLRAYMWSSLSIYNGSKRGHIVREAIAKILASAQVVEAQKMSTSCLESGYTDC